jgi:predicted TIM-barrel fold metal-dependent hydrolase
MSLESYHIVDANIRLGRLGASDGPSFDEPADLLRFMDQNAIAHALVYHALARESDFIAGNQLLTQQLQHHRDRLTPAWVIVPNRQPDEALIRQLDEHDIPAVRLFPLTGHFSVAPWCIASLAQALSDAGKLLLIDYETVSWAADATDWRAIDELCTAFPKLPILLTGVAAAGPSNYRPLMLRHPNLHLEISKLPTPREINHLINQGCAARLIYGSDMPIRHFGAPLAMLNLLDISPQQRQDILANNLTKLLSRTPSSRHNQPRPRLDNSAIRYTFEQPESFGKIVDTHVHLGGWNPSMAGAGTPADTIADMNRCGIQRIVATSLWACYGQVARGNQAVAAAAQAHPGRIHGYITLDPKHPEEVRQQLDTHGSNPAFLGIKLHGQTHAVNITDPRCQPILQYAHDRQWPMLIHGNFHPEPWQQVATQYPNANLIVAHISGCGLDTPSSPGALAIARLCRKHDNLYFDIAASCSYYACLPELIKLAGADHILYGSDHPIFDFGYELGQVFHSSISQEDQHHILHQNAHRLFAFTQPTDSFCQPINKPTKPIHQPGVPRFGVGVAVGGARPLGH